MISSEFPKQGGKFAQGANMNAVRIEEHMDRAPTNSDRKLFSDSCYLARCI
jgi:hypothetical protein